METPRLYIDDQIELCDGHADYGHSILYCEHAGKKMEVYRTSYRTNRLNEQMEGIFSLRVRATISWHFGVSAGRADARRRDAGDVVTSSRSGNAADARPPPRPAGLLAPRLANFYVTLL